MERFTFQGQSYYAISSAELADADRTIADARAYKPPRGVVSRYAALVQQFRSALAALADERQQVAQLETIGWEVSESEGAELQALLARFPQHHAAPPAFVEHVGVVQTLLRKFGGWKSALPLVLAGLAGAGVLLFLVGRRKP